MGIALRGGAASTAFMGALAVSLSSGWTYESAPFPPTSDVSCYRIHLDRWSPTPQGGLVPFLSLPPLIRFEEDLGVEGPETGRQLVRPRQALAGRITWAYRRPSDDAFDIQVVFVNEAASIHLNLYERSWGWIGDASARTGAGSSHRGRIRLETVSCVP